MVVTVVIGVLVLFLIGLLWTPVIIQVDTDLNKYDVSLFGIVKAWLSVEEDELKTHVWILGYHRKSSPKFLIAEKTEEDKRKKKRKNVPKLRLGRTFNAIRSFKVKTFEVSLDTDDYVLNAKLVPVSWLIRLLGVNVTINFQGNSYCRLEIRNNLWRMTSAYLKLKKY